MEGKEAPVSNLTDLLADIKTEFPSFKLMRKEDSKFMKTLAVLVKPFCPDFQQSFGTTIGKTVYYPSHWDDSTLYEVLRHERVHMRDSDKWGPLYYLTYVLLPLPFIISGRAYWEFRGYCETLKVLWEFHGKPVGTDGLPVLWRRDLDWVVEQFTGPSYLFMLPMPKLLRRAFERASAGWNA